jgi:hypothetical protein
VTVGSRCRPVGDVGAHLDVDVDEATVGYGHASLVGDNLLAFGGASVGWPWIVTSMKHWASDKREINKVLYKVHSDHVFSSENASNL